MAAILLKPAGANDVHPHSVSVPSDLRARAVFPQTTLTAFVRSGGIFRRWLPQPTTRPAPAAAIGSNKEALKRKTRHAKPKSNRLIPRYVTFHPEIRPVSAPTIPDNKTQPKELRRERTNDPENQPSRKWVVPYLPHRE